MILVKTLVIGLNESHLDMMNNEIEFGFSFHYDLNLLVKSLWFSNYNKLQHLFHFEPPFSPLFHALSTP